MRKHKCKGECVICGQYVFEEDLDWMVKRFEKIEYRLQRIEFKLSNLKEILENDTKNKDK